MGTPARRELKDSDFRMAPIFVHQGWGQTRHWQTATFTGGGSTDRSPFHPSF